MLSNESAPLAEVAEALGRPEAWLRRNWLKLALRDGFPRKHPSGWTWPRAAVAAWLRGSSPAAQPAAINDNATLSRDDAYAAALAERYGGNR